MPGRVFVDTSFVIALVNEDDQHHETALSLSHKFETSPLITTDAVLLEIGNSLAKSFRKQAIQIIKVLRGSKHTEIVSIDQRSFEKGLRSTKDIAIKTGDWWIASPLQ